MPPEAMPAAAPVRLADRLVWGAAGAVAWPVLGTAAWLHPDARGFGTHQQLGLPPCTFEAMTRVPCPGCGLTTSFAAMAHGHVVEALRAHLMGPLLFALTVAVAAAAPGGVRRGWSVLRVLSQRSLTMYLGATLAAGLTTFALRLWQRFG